MNTQTENPAKVIAYIVGALLILAALLMFQGCSTTQQTAAIQAVDTTDSGVRLSMTGWGIFQASQKAAGKPVGTNAEQVVLTGFLAVRSAELTVIDTTLEVATNVAATNKLVAASIIQSNAAYYLVTTIGKLTNQ